MKHPAGGLLYRFRVNAIPNIEISAEAKQKNLAEAVKALSDKCVKEPQPVKFKSDTFVIQKYPGNPLDIPISWTLIDRRWLVPGPGHAPALEERTPEVHQDWDDSIGTGTLISGVANCGPTLPWIAQTFFPAIIPAFDAYRAELEPSDLLDADRSDPFGIEGWRQYRWKVYALTAVSFFDDRLCISAFGIDAEEVAKRIGSEVPFVKLINLRNRKGVLMQLVQEYVDSRALMPVRTRVMRAIWKEADNA